MANFCKGSPYTFSFPLYVVSAYEGYLQSRDITRITSPPQANAVDFCCLCFITFFNIFFSILKGNFSYDFSLHYCIPPRWTCATVLYCSLAIDIITVNDKLLLVLFSRSTDEKGRTFDVKLNKRLMLYTIRPVVRIAR